MRLTHTDEFLDKLKEMYPDIEEKVLKLIIKEGFYNLITLVSKGKDVNLSGREGYERILIYKRVSKDTIRKLHLKKIAKRKRNIPKLIRNHILYQ